MDAMDTETNPSTFPVNVPESAKPFVDQEVERGGYASRGAYLAKLVEDARIREQQERLEAKLTEGLNSPAEPATEETFAEDRAEFESRLSEHRGR